MYMAAYMLRWRRKATTRYAIKVTESSSFAPKSLKYYGIESALWLLYIII